MKVNIPKAFSELFQPHRYKIYFGGRGSGKSVNIARALLIRGVQKPLTILCTREIQTSINDSVHRLLREQIEVLGLSSCYRVTQNSIYGDNGTEFIFKGLRFNVREIKSTEGVDICWCFPAGTKVDGKNIEEIKEGDYVLSYNHATNLLEKRKVLKTFKNAYSKPLYKLTYAGTNSIIATGEHPFYVKGKGYVALKDIRKGDVIYEKDMELSSRSPLFGWLWRNDSNKHGRKETEVQRKRRCVLQGLCEKNAFGKNESQQSNEQSSVTGETEKSFARERTQANSFRWKRARLYTRAKAFVGAFRSRLVGGIYRSYWTLSGRKWIPDAFQNRFGQFILWDSDRSRRWKPQRGKGTPRGQEEGRLLKEQRVESVEVQKQGSFGQCGQGNGQNYVYNIEVEGNNNYFANGILVHNCEEAQAISNDSWEVLIPTIREPNSEIWITFNPLDESDPTYQRFVLNPPNNAYIRKVNYDENPYFPEVLRQEMEWLKSRDYQSYLHVWEGEVRRHSNALIFGGYFTVEDFETPKDARLYFGCDWGFSSDPTTLIRCFIDGKRLYIDQEAWAIGCEIDRTPALFDKIEGSRKWPIKADNARPETISYMRRQGFNIKGAKKWQGSVEDGVEFLKTFDIIIHPRCQHTIDEFNHYSYKVDKQTGDVLPIIVDSYNHCIDALRYSLDGVIKGKGEMKINPDILAF